MRKARPITNPKVLPQSRQNQQGMRTDEDVLERSTEVLIS